MPSAEDATRPTSSLALTKRSAIMEAQVDILEGKLKILTRFRESLRRYSAELDRASMGGAVPQHTPDKLDTSTPLPPAVSRLVLAAQEDLRREIARAMHDGPAQSLTNIVLQAQIVERLLDRDPAQAKTEIGQLVDMVQHTLDATKTFIFDVRPMVLDDLGLVPTLRRVARDRGRRSQIPDRVRVVRHGPAPADGRRERPLPHHRRDRHGLPVLPSGSDLDPLRVGRDRPRPGSPPGDEGVAEVQEVEVGCAVAAGQARQGRRSGRSPRRSGR